MKREILEDPRECKHYYPELKACKYQEELAKTFGGVRIMVCEGDKCEYFTPKTDKINGDTSKDTR